MNRFATLDGRVASLLPVGVELIRGQNTKRQTGDPSDRQLNLFINRHKQFRRFVESTASIQFDSSGGNSRREIRQLLQIIWISILNFQVQFQLAPFIIFLMIAMKLL